jgi:hypothetical protein
MDELVGAVLGPALRVAREGVEADDAPVEGRLSG